MEFRKEDVIFKGVLLGGNSGQDASFIWYFKKKTERLCCFRYFVISLSNPQFCSVRNVMTLGGRNIRIKSMLG